MATIMDLDETLCEMPVCQHPQCWMTFSRIRKGHPRYRPAASLSRTPRINPELPVSTDGLPVLNVTTLPMKNLQNEQDVRCSSSVTFSRMSSTSMYNPYNSVTCSMDKILFPGMNSYRQIIAAPRRVDSFISTKQSWKVAAVDPYLQDLKTKHARMVWVPKSHQKSQQKREKPLKVQIKELTIADISGQQKKENRDSDVPKIRKGNKPPTGGCPHNLILTNSPIQTHTKKWITASNIKENSEKIIRIKRSPNEHHSYSESESDLGPNSLLPENHRVVLHDNRSKHRSSPSISQSGPVYKLDEQPLDTLSDMGIDLNRIRNQYYLWKKYIGLAGPGCRILPLGSLMGCDTERSHDLESRDSPSSAGFSQTSWTEVEQFDAPADVDTRKINEECPGDQNEEVLNQLQGYETISQTPDLKHEQLKGEEKSVKESEFPDTPEPNIQGSEVTDGHYSPEQRVLSPQPNPPPPSPTHDSINSIM